MSEADSPLHRERPPGALQITRLAVEQLRRFREPFELGDLAPGLNVIAAPNESGKSTLVRALRAAFFERHRSSGVEDLRPWGDPQAAPRIELDFVLGGVPHHLSKQFLQRKRCVLRIGDRTLDGAEAEDHLADSFGFSFASKGASRPEHWGIPGLLWVEQGAAPQLPVQPAHEHLRVALQGLSSADHAVAQASADLVARRGDALLERFAAQRDELLTGKGKARGSLAEAQAEWARTQTELAQMDARIEDYRGQVDQLQRVQAELDAAAAQRPWEAVEARLSEAREQQLQLQLREQQLAADQARLQQIDRQRQWLDTELAHAAELQLQARQRQEAEARARQVLAQADLDEQARRAEADAAAARATSARQAARHAREQAMRMRQLAQTAAQRQAAEQQLAQRRTELATARERLLQAQAHAQRLQQARERLTALPRMTEADVQRLQQLERAQREQALALEAIATRIRFELPAGQGMVLRREQGSAEPLSGRGDRLLDGAAELELAGGGRLHIQPGGADLSERQRAAAAADAAWRSAGEALGVAGLAQARERWLAVHEQTQQVTLAQQALAIVAPEGLGNLQQALDNAQAAVDHLTAQRAALGEDRDSDGDANALAIALAHGDGIDAPAGPVPDRGAGCANPLDPEHALAAETQAIAAEDAAEVADRLAQQALAQARQLQSAARSHWQAAEQEAQVAAARAADPDGAKRHQQARADRLAVQGEFETLSARVGLSREALQIARPDIVAQDIQRLGRSAAAMRDAHQQLRERQLVLQAALQQAGAQGLEEQRAGLAAEHERARRRVDELQLRADALDWLCRRLQSRRQAALDRLQAPLQQRLQHYLPLWMPGARLHTDEHLAPARLSRPASAAGLTGTGDGGLASPFSGAASGEGTTGMVGATDTGPLDDHSFGAREQLALLCRLAYADLLQQAGRPTLLILDDALTHTDEARLDRMKRALFDAAQRHQVLVFTCHPNAWRDAGVPIRQL